MTLQMMGWREENRREGRSKGDKHTVQVGWEKKGKQGRKGTYLELDKEIHCMKENRKGEASKIYDGKRREGQEREGKLG